MKAGDTHYYIEHITTRDSSVIRIPVTIVKLGTKDNAHRVIVSSEHQTNVVVRVRDLKTDQ